MEFDNKLKPKALPMKLYHASNSDFETPDPNKSYRGQYGSGFYTSTNPNEAKEYGRNLYEYDFQGGNFFNPKTYQFNDDQKKIMVDMFKQLQPNITQDQIDHFLRGLDDPSGRAYSDSVINKLRFLSNSNDLRPILQKLGINAQGLEVPLENYDWLEGNRTHYIIFDPKTLKMVKKTKKE